MLSQIEWQHRDRDDRCTRQTITAMSSHRSPEGSRTNSTHLRGISGNGVVASNRDRLALRSCKSRQIATMSRPSSGPCERLKFARDPPTPSSGLRACLAVRSTVRPSIEYPRLAIADACPAQPLGPNVDDDSCRFAGADPQVDRLKRGLPLGSRSGRLVAVRYFAQDRFRRQMSIAAAAGAVRHDKNRPLGGVNDQGAVFTPLAARHRQTRRFELVHVRSEHSSRAYSQSSPTKCSGHCHSSGYSLQALGLLNPLDRLHRRVALLFDGRSSDSLRL